MDNRLETHLTAGDTRFFVLGNERYLHRAERVMEHLRAQEGWLSTLHPELRIGRDFRKRFCPPDFREMKTWQHWWAASCDHIDALEDGLVSGCQYLLVLEDDAHLTDDFDDQMQLAWRTVPPSWKAIRLGWNQSGVTGMIATLWSRKGMIEAYEYFQQHRHRVIDRAFADLREASPSGWHQTDKRLVIEAGGAKQCGRDS